MCAREQAPPIREVIHEDPIYDNLTAQWSPDPPTSPSSSLDSSQTSTSPGSSGYNSTCSLTSPGEKLSANDRDVESPEKSTNKTSPELQSSAKNNNRLPYDFQVLPLRYLIEQKVKNKKMDTSVRKSIVGDNCNAVWQFTQQLNGEGRQRMAKMIVTKYPFLRQPNNPPEVRTC